MSLQLNVDAIINNINKAQKSNKQETRKNKLKENSNKKLWTIFDEEYKEKPDFECVYTKEKDMLTSDNLCANCANSLFIGEDGFLTCSNICCGLIYKDNLDQTAEWRFYGADDNSHSDPTRCGMPINPFYRSLLIVVKYCAQVNRVMKCIKSADIPIGKLCHIKKSRAMMNFN